MRLISLASFAAAVTALTLQLNVAECSPERQNYERTTEALTLHVKSANHGGPTNVTANGITTVSVGEEIRPRRAGRRNLRERERPHIGGPPVSIGGGDEGGRNEFPRVYSAKVRGHNPGASYTREELAENFFVMEVDALEILEKDLPASRDELDQASREGLGPKDFARISFLVTSEEELERLEGFARAHQGRVSSRGHASEMRFEAAITKEFLTANGIDAGGRRDDEKGEGRPGPSGPRPNARKKRNTYSTIPDYSCYRNLAGTFAFLDDLSQMSVPGLTIQVTDIGDSYLKTANQGGDDIRALKLTGDNGGTATNTKGIFFAMFGIHAREFAPVEVGARFVEMLVDEYGNDAEITALLDHTEIHIVLQSNPDGRDRAETLPQPLHRKNLNPSYSSSCTGNNVGVDLNRNFPFKWGLNSGSSSNPCSATYRGPSQKSEPETQAIVNYVEALFPQDQRKTDPEGGDINTAYDDSTTTGIFFDVHAYGEINIWPWGWVEQPNANDVGLQALARKMRSINGYELAGPDQTGWIYEVSGATTDYVYGTLGASSATLELGQSFQQPCPYFESDIVDRSIGALLYAASVSKLPYSIVKGPEVTDLAYTVDEDEKTITVTAEVSDIAMLLQGSESTYPTGTQNIASVKLYIDEHPDDATMPAPVAIDMTASDGAYDEVAETVAATTSWVVTGNRHALHVQATDSDGYAGPIRSAYFLESPTPSPTPAPTAPIIEASYNSALGAPSCDEVGSACDASSSTGIVKGRGTKGPEPNQPNTIDSCSDGTSGSYRSDESIEGLSVRSTDGEVMRKGSSAEIVVDVFAWSTGSSDWADFYHAADASNPSWVFIATQPAGAGGDVTLTQSFTLASGSTLQAVRVNFRYQGSASSCSGGSYDDVDDLVFTVAPSGCSAAPTCPHGCDESADSCFECAVNADCDNGIFCDGQEACVDNVCVTGDAVDCDDGVSCTVDSCNEGTDSCDNIADHARCDNGLFCDGVETCDAVLDCQGGTNPTCTHDCDESTDSCFDCSDNLDCDNGIFCDGTELCSSGRCESGTAPTCANGCNEATNSCNEECSQGVDCDDGNYCNGVETCSSGTCADGAAPTCPHGCDEVSDSCFECAANADCDNGIFCDGQEACVNNVCADGAAPTCPHGCDESADSCFECAVNADCDNGIFCDGHEACVNNVCVTGSVVDCDDNVACTVDSCNEVAESCEHTPNSAACDNGFFCDGDETCDAVLGCQIGTPVSCNDGVGCTDDSCSESTGQCEFVPNNANCNSGEVCDGQACVVTTGWTTILSNDFESGWQNFNDGGSDAARRSDGTSWVHSGLFALRIRDGRDSSAVVETDPLDTSNYEDAKVSFWFRPRGVENGEAFSLQTSACDGIWDTVTTWTRASEWSSNGRWYGVGDGGDFTAVEFPTMGDCTAIRFRCEGNQNNDRVYIDDVLVEAN